MWSELLEDVVLELELLRKLVDQTEPLRKAIAAGAAGETEKLAAASLLQSFYNGVENVFDAFAERLDGHRPAGAGRHEPLLDQMSEPTGARPAVVSEELRAGLKQYLEFRNSYRYSHYFRLNWPLMAALVAQMPATFERLEAELDRFVREHGKRRLIGRPEPAALPAYWFAPPEEARPARWRGLAGPCVLAGLVGLALGVGVAALAGRMAAGTERQAFPAAQVRKLTDALASALRPWQGEPAIRHAVGVLEFFQRDDWTFTYSGSKWEFSGELTGTSKSLDATARLLFAQGYLGKIEIDTSFDRYVFAVQRGTLRRAAHFERTTGMPRTTAEFGRDGAPACLAEWPQQDAGSVRRERFFHRGRAVAEIVCRSDGAVEKVILRTGSDPQETAVFLPTRPGSLAPDTAARDKARDLPPPTATKPAGP